MGKNRPDFNDIKSFEEFNKYYWYREELSKICKSLGLEYRNTKQELNEIIKEYFNGNRVEKTFRMMNRKKTDIVTLKTPLLECGFKFNKKFRDYFSVFTGVMQFKFNADMATAWRKVKIENDTKFTMQDMIKIYYGDSNYAKYNNSVCQWNQFLKDFCLDEFSKNYSNKLKVASILWKEVKETNDEKVYSRKLLNKFSHKVEKYRK